jgi:hypothetical protein
VRVEADSVQEVFETNLTDAQVSAFINMAHRFVDANLLDEGLAAGTLTDIELMLSCHFCALNDPRMKSENVAGEWSFTVQGMTGLSLDATFYGQNAKLLDPTGKLDELGANLKQASISALEDMT